MDKRKLLKHIAIETEIVWDSLCEIYTPLVRFNPPKIVLNPYTWKTAGSCYQTLSKVELGYKFFASNRENFNYMIDVILPHELAHQADFNLFGESEKTCGHGEKWCEIMVNLGLKAKPFHSMEIER